MIKRSMGLGIAKSNDKATVSAFIVNSTFVDNIQALNVTSLSSVNVTNCSFRVAASAKIVPDYGPIYFNFTNLDSIHVISTSFSCNLPYTSDILMIAGALTCNIAYSTFISNEADNNILRISASRGNVSTIRMIANRFEQNRVNSVINQAAITSVYLLKGASVECIMEGNTYLQNASPTRGTLSIYGSLLGKYTANCVRESFIRNSANAGAGIYISFANVRVQSSMFIQNVARFGGAMYAVGSEDVLIQTCTFKGNSATTKGGAIRIRGLINEYRNVVARTITVANSLVVDNTAFSGGGIDLESNISEHLLINSCLVTQNSASGSGGAFYVRPLSPAYLLLTIVNTTLASNSANKLAGVVYFHGSALSVCNIMNSTFNLNRAREATELYFPRSSSGNVSVQQSFFFRDISQSDVKAFFKFGGSYSVTFRNNSVIKEASHGYTEQLIEKLDVEFYSGNKFVLKVNTSSFISNTAIYIYQLDPVDPDYPIHITGSLLGARNGPLLVFDEMEIYGLAGNYSFWIMELYEVGFVTLGKIEIRLVPCEDPFVASSIPNETYQKCALGKCR
jgi:predicted outer membrane repeat protein